MLLSLFHAKSRKRLMLIHKYLFDVIDLVSTGNECQHSSIKAELLKHAGNCYELPQVPLIKCMISLLMNEVTSV